MKQVPKKDHYLFENEADAPADPTLKMSVEDKAVWEATLKRDRELYGAK